MAEHFNKMGWIQSQAFSIGSFFCLPIKRNVYTACKDQMN